MINLDLIEEAKLEILDLIRPRDEHINLKIKENPQAIVQKVIAISGILKDFPVIREDAELLELLYTFTAKTLDSTVLKFRNEFLFNYMKISDSIESNEALGLSKSFDKVSGVLSISKEQLESIEKIELLNFFAKHDDMKEFNVILKDQTIFTYNDVMLSQYVNLYVNKGIVPEIKDWTRWIEMRFMYGDKLVKKERPTIATLLLCGDYFHLGLLKREYFDLDSISECDFESEIEFRSEIEHESVPESEPGSESVLENNSLSKKGSNLASKSNFRSTNSKVLSLEAVPSEGFLGILYNVRTRMRDPRISERDYFIAMDYLQYEELYQIFPVENLYGKNSWENFWGAVGKVDGLPQKAFDYCPIENKGKKSDGLRMIDTHVFLWIPSKIDGNKLTLGRIRAIARADKSRGYKINYDIGHYRVVKDPNVYQSNSKGYWLAIYKKSIREIQGKDYAQQKAYIEQNYPKGYGFPKTREALLYYVMPYVSSKSLIQVQVQVPVQGQNQPLTAHIRCEELVEGSPVSVGFVLPNGYCIFHHKDHDPETSVLIARRFGF